MTFGFLCVFRIGNLLCWGVLLLCGVFRDRACCHRSCRTSITHCCKPRTRLLEHRIPNRRKKHVSVIGYRPGSYYRCDFQWIQMQHHLHSQEAHCFYRGARVYTTVRFDPITITTTATQQHQQQQHHRTTKKSVIIEKKNIYIYKEKSYNGY